MTADLRHAGGAVRVDLPFTLVEQGGAARGGTMEPLHCGDNLSVLRESIAADIVDLIYRDPPFHANASETVPCMAPDGGQSAAQIEGLDDTWRWAADWSSDDLSARQGHDFGL